MFHGEGESVVIFTFIHKAFEMPRGLQNFKSVYYRGKSQSVISFPCSVAPFLRYILVLFGFLFRFFFYYYYSMQGTAGAS